MRYQFSTGLFISTVSFSFPYNKHANTFLKFATVNSKISVSGFFCKTSEFLACNALNFSNFILKCVLHKVEPIRDLSLSLGLSLTGKHVYAFMCDVKLLLRIRLHKILKVTQETTLNLKLVSLRHFFLSKACPVLVKVCF